MAESQTITGRRLILEPFSERFLSNRYIDWLNDPEVVRFSEQRHRRHTFESCKAYIESMEKSPHCFWAIVLTGKIPEHIGNMTAYIDPTNSIAEISILIGEKKEWGRGYATEAWREVCNYLLDTRKIRKITGGTLSVNVAMIRVMKKIGMVEDGYRVRHYLWENREIDILYMAKFNESH